MMDDVENRSVSMSVLILYGFALGWLIVWSVLNIILPIQLIYPDFAGGHAWLSYGRLRPLANNVFLYGWASSVGMGTSLWLMAHLGRNVRGSSGMVIIGALFWNIGLLAGLIALDVGYGRSLEYLELPAWSHLIMWSGLVLIVLRIVDGFQYRDQEAGSIPQMFIVGAHLWLCLSLLSANLFSMLPGVKGISLVINAAWHGGNLTGLWLTGLAMGVIYFLIPQTTGKSIEDTTLARGGFWLFTLFYSWTGLSIYNGGPVPAWLVTLSIGATILTLLPAFIILANHAMPMASIRPLLASSPSLRFALCGLVGYGLSCFTSVFLSLRSVNAHLGLTFVVQAQSQLVLYGVFSMVMFGAIYLVLPRIVQREWPSSTSTQMHFWSVFYGIGLTMGLLVIAGFLQNRDWNNPLLDSVLAAQAPLTPLRGTIAGGVLLLFGHMVFAGHFLRLIFCKSRQPEVNSPA